MARLEQLRLPVVPSRLDEATKAIGRRGIAKARAALAATKPPDDMRSLHRRTEARKALARITGRTPNP